MIKEDVFVMGGENRTQVNIVYQKQMKPGPDLREKIFDMLTVTSDETKSKLPLTQVEEETEENYTVNTLEEAIQFFVQTINYAFGSADQNANEVTDFLMTTEDSSSVFETTEGGMFLFKYEPTTKRKLKYFDRLPLIINTGKTSDGITGLNLHYLPNRYRIAFLRTLFGSEDLDDLNEDDIQIRLSGLSTYKFIRPTYKQYKYDGIASRLVRIPIENWTLASLLPISNFQKKSRREVWDESVKLINEQEREL